MLSGTKLRTPVGFNVGSSSNALRAPPTALRATMAFESPRALRGCMVLLLNRLNVGSSFNALSGTAHRAARDLCFEISPSTSWLEPFDLCEVAAAVLQQPHTFIIMCKNVVVQTFFCNFAVCN